MLEKNPAFREEMLDVQVTFQSTGKNKIGRRCITTGP